LKPEQRTFALGLYEYPSMPDYEATREYFRRIADAESDALAELAEADWDKLLTLLPVDEERVARIRAADEESLNRPAEYWNPYPAPLDFPWAANLPGEPLRAALLVPRWSAYDTMELARRFEMDVRHQYFDTNTAITSAGRWHYRAQTGIGPLSRNLAMRNAVHICTDPNQNVIVVSVLKREALEPRLLQAIQGQVKDGKGLVITGGGDTLAGWPDEMFVEEDSKLLTTVLSYLPWNNIPSLREGGRGRLGEAPPLRCFRYGKGRIFVFQANIAAFCALLPLRVSRSASLWRP